jgi:DTW domain-containing protein
MVIDVRAKQKFNRYESCEKCCRLKTQCLCGKVTALDNRIKIVVLQHPQEQYKALNSARLAQLMLKNSAVFVGLSWPNFKKIAGPDEMPSQWGVLVLKPGQSMGNWPVSVINRKKKPVGNTSFLRGFVVLDGSWKQAKALWWRNPWLLKLNRIGLNPDHPSLRAQVKKEGLATIEAIAFALEHLGEKPVIPQELRGKYRELIIGRFPSAGTGLTQ